MSNGARRHLIWFTTAVRYNVIEHSRNKFAMLLVVAFVPTWTVLAYLVIPKTPIPFRLRATGQLLAPAGNQMTQLTGALNAVALITGFMMFAATFTGGRFDKRLALAGYPRPHLVLAKAATLTLASALVAAYATAVICMAWSPKQPLQLATALFSSAMTYGALGVVFGSVLRREVEGMFAVAMTSIVDITLQNPTRSSSAGSPLVHFLPSHGAIQTATASGFSTTHTPDYLALQALWFTATALLALLAFHRRTRNALPPKAAGVGLAHVGTEASTVGIDITTTPPKQSSAPSLAP
ncbi:ABC transporter permease [Streptomyces sp. RKAG293]|uniref:ABC transporter permease n=1 Tax=Streptomyces sp. RKAG293 TaxID=2893403 RepID=UPI0020343B5B|nr:ABC transporter permease [Streptomyces sp. RKAG293]MCM2422690.1 ABC transporter permease [Streptomyces sp. RKAG293]